MNWYELSRSIFDYAFEHKECGVYHISIYLWMVELNNRMGWKKEFWVPSHDTCDWLSIWNKNTYLSAIKDLEKWGFIKIVKESKNQFSATIVTICRIKSDTATTTALDTALIQQSTRHWYAIDTIDKQRNKETKNKETIQSLTVVVEKTELELLLIEFKRARAKLRKPMTDKAMELLLKKLSEYSEPEQIAMLEEAIEKGWQSVYPPKTENKAGKNVKVMEAIANYNFT